MKTYIIILSLAFFAALSSSYQQPFSIKASIARGQEVYMTKCVNCHMAEGKGLDPVYPSLVKSEWLAQKDRLVQLIVKGMRGEIKAGGKTYNGEMAPAGTNDEETADVINYVRNSWGNKGLPVKPKEIQPALKVVVKGFQSY